MKNFHKYLSVGDSEKAWGFYIISLGYTKISSNQAYPNNKEHPPSHSFTWNRGRILHDYTLVFISNGEGVFESSQVSLIKIKAGNCFFLYPGVWHRYKPNPNSGWEEYWVGFQGSYPDELMLKDFFSLEAPIINTGLNENLLNLFHKLIDTVKSTVPGYHQVITGITLEILGLVYAISKFKDENNDPTTRLISKARFLLQESIEQPINMGKMVKDLPMGYSKFRKAFKQITGFAPNQYYLDIRINKAKELLISTDLSIDRISYLTGFESPFYFSKLFKKKNAIPPLSYRSSKRNLKVL